MRVWTMFDDTTAVIIVFVGRVRLNRLLTLISQNDRTTLPQLKDLNIKIKYSPIIAEIPCKSASHYYENKGI